MKPLTNRFTSFALFFLFLPFNFLQATIRYVARGKNPTTGQPIILCGLEHWANDVEAVEQAAYLTAITAKKPCTVLLEHNALYSSFEAPAEKLNTERARLYPHYRYAYQGLSSLTQSLATELVQHGVPLKRATVKKKMKLCKRKEAPTSNQVCPVALLVNSVSPASPSTFKSIDERENYMMASSLLTAIQAFKGMELEELVPFLELDEDYLDSFSFADLVTEGHTTASQFKRLVLKYKSTNKDLASYLAGMSISLKQEINDLEVMLEQAKKFISFQRPDHNEEVTSKSSFLIFLDRLIKAMNAPCDDEEIQIPELENIHFKLSSIFSYKMCLSLLPYFEGEAEPVADKPIFVVAGADHILILQAVLEFMSFKFTPGCLENKTPQLLQAPAKCTKQLHAILQGW